MLCESPNDPCEIDPATLLPLVGVRRMSRQFGYVLRHYWMPATELTFQRTTCRGSEPPVSETIVRRLARCDSDVCCWREMIDDATVLRIYNRSDQTLRTREITGHESRPESERDARIRAFVHVPILTPLLPIPLGFRWHVATDEGDFLDFTLESVTEVGDMPVLFVRRQGRFQCDGVTVERNGITAYALDRSAILEDRTCDVVDGVETITVTKLVQSRLLETVATVALAQSLSSVIPAKAGI